MSFKVPIWRLPREPRKTTKNLPHRSQPMNKDTKPGTPEYEAGVVTTQQSFSLPTFHLVRAAHMVTEVHSILVMQ